jgi:hypothetical protein
MFLIVRQSDNVIIGSAIKAINIDEFSKKGYVIFEIPDKEFTPKLIGSKLEEYEHWND